MSENKNQQAVVVKREDAGIVEYIPLGGSEKVKLSIKIVQDYIAVPTRSGKSCSVRDAMRFVAMCQAKHINPFEGDCYLIGFDGKNGPEFQLITAHQTYLKRAELHPEFDGMQSGVIVRDNESKKILELEGDFYIKSDQELLGGWAKVYFKNRKIPMYRRGNLERFRKNFGVWLDDPAGMCVKCIESDCLRSSFPTMLGGMLMREEVEIPDQRMIPAKPKFERPAGVTVSFPEPPPAPAPEEPTRPEPQEPEDGDLFTDPGQQQPQTGWRSMPVPHGAKAGTLFGKLTGKDLEYWVSTWQPNPTKPFQLEIRAALDEAGAELGLPTPPPQDDIPT